MIKHHISGNYCNNGLINPCEGHGAPSRRGLNGQIKARSAKIKSDDKVKIKGICF